MHRILALNPWIEVVVKYLYWHFPLLNRVLGKMVTKLRRTQTRSRIAEVAVNHETATLLWQQLHDWGVNAGDILIVHSSMSNLKSLGLSPPEINAALRALVGDPGTLAMPAIPYFPEEPVGVDRLSDRICQVPVAYDVEKTMPWTGALPKALMQTPGAVRSHHPLSTMVAVGPEASVMMAHNLDGEAPLPGGVHSSWYYCANRNAKIVALGTDMAHSLTMIHVAEDAYENDWPIANWYRLRLFDITSGGVTRRITVRERHPKWAIHYAERTLANDLRRAGILRATTVYGVTMEFLESAALLDFLNARKAKGYPYFTLAPHQRHGAV